MTWINTQSRTRPAETCAPPRFRILILFSAAVLILALGFLASGDQRSSAQTTPLVDYDIDDDGLIDVRTANQWRAIHYDLDGNGVSESRTAPSFATNTPWATGYPNAMTGAGCPARDHDDDPATPDEPSCIGYELINDISLAGGRITLGIYGMEFYERDSYTAKIVGNGFRIENNHREHDDSCCSGLVSSLNYTGVIEGIGVSNPRYQSHNGRTGGIAGRLEGKVIGSYVHGGFIRGGGGNGGIAGVVPTDTTQGYGLIAHSFVRGATVGIDSTRNGGLAGIFERQRGTDPVNQATCLNSYFSGDVDAITTGARRVGLIVGEAESSQGRFINCVGDSTTDAGEGDQSTIIPGANVTSGATAVTYANMTAATGYTGPFANWDDYPTDGTITQLDATEPRVDVWDFGDETTLPELKGWGHDRTFALVRDESGTDTVNLCTRTPAVANEIIRLLKDDTYADGVTGPVPADITSLGTCTSSADTQSVSIDNLRDYAATTAANPLNLNPGRTDPAAAKLTTISRNDFAYLVNVSHIDLSGNALASVPPRLFQGLRLRWLDLSNNELVSLPADLFAGLANIPITARTGNAIHLNGNRLTDTGIPGRIFDTLPHINGIDLRDNALTRINTRWFERLAALGDKPASATAPVSYLGIGLSGNTATEHYYAHKLFSGVRDNVVQYTGATAGDTLKTAIVAAITAAAGGTTPADLDLDSIDYYVNAGANAGYQPSGTTCPSSGTFGTLGDAYIGATPDCYILPHWTAPSTATATVAAPTGGAIALETDGLTVTFSHPTSTAIVAYEIRHRLLPSDRDSDWAEHWEAFAITPAAGTKSFTLTHVAAIGAGHQVQIRAVTTDGHSAPLSLVLAPDLDAPADLTVTDESGTLVLQWNGPENFSVDRYEFRTRRTGTTDWSDWTSVDHTGALGSQQTHRITNVESGTSLQIQVRYVIATATSPIATASGSTRVAVPDVDTIKPAVRELTVSAGQDIALTVDVYNAQKRLDNGLATSDNSPLMFRWSESGAGGGSFTTPLNDRRITYTVPNLPGRYTVTAEAQPDGICISHHAGATEITAADRAPCIATFTISVTGAPGQFGTKPDPINPAGIIPTSFTDDEGIAYSVFTPVDGGTFTGEDIAITASAGAIPDRSLLGVNASVSAVPVPAPVPGASMSVAGVFYDINAITQDGSAPLPSYTLDKPLTACLPFPTEFRAALSNVVAVERKPDGNLAILTTKVRSDAGDLSVCGAVSALPATVGVAKLGTVPAIAPTQMPEEELPEAGGAAPSATIAVLILLAGVLLLTAIGRIGRMLSK